MFLTVEPLVKVFLTPAEVPRNPQKLRKGLKVLLKTPREFIKSGYRKNATDFLEQAREEARDIRFNYPEIASKMMTRDLVWALARGLSRGLGGPERGVWVSPLPNAFIGRAFEITEFSSARIGLYYPPRGSGEDFENGGLSEARTVSVLHLSHDNSMYRVLAGDVEVIEP